MGRFAIVLSLLAGCSFEAPVDHSGGTTDGGPGGDAGGDVDDAPGPPADARCMIGSIDACDETALPALTLEGTLNTTSDSRCRSNDVCLVYANGVTVANLAVIGARPLVIVSTANITVTGVLDVSSRRGGQLGAAANDPACAAMRAPENDAGGAAGGAGGSYGATGGNGGTGDSDDSIGPDGTALGGLAGASASFTGMARGGCRGSSGADEVGGDNGNGGAGGNSGGAVWLAATGTVSISGGIRATGAGGDGAEVQSGGGGGGSGGLIVIEAAMIDVAGPLSANGGSGGAGGTRINGTPIGGNPGHDGDFGTTPAPGGLGPTGSAAGPGGMGSAGTTRTGGPGASSIVGGGGGGGSAGIIRLVGAVQGSGTISPPAI